MKPKKPERSEAEDLFRARSHEGGRAARTQLPQQPHGDRLNAILCGVGQNVRLLLRWFALLLCVFLAWLYEAVLSRQLSPA